jgi:hypothetical protein
MVNGPNTNTVIGNGYLSTSNMFSLLAASEDLTHHGDAVREHRALARFSRKQRFVPATSKPQQHEMTKSQRKNKQRAEKRRLKREDLLFFSWLDRSYANSRNDVEARVIILRSDVDLVTPLVIRQAKNVKLIGAGYLAKRFSVPWNTFASTILFASRSSSQAPGCMLHNLHEPALRLIADYAGVQHKSAVAEWLKVEESDIKVLEESSHQWDKVRRRIDHKFVRGMNVEYISSTNGKWVSATVKKVHSDGTMTIISHWAHKSPWLARVGPSKVRVVDNYRNGSGDNVVFVRRQESNTRNSRVVINVNDISVAIFGVDSGAP